ncbi:unnamed protein product [Lasius platythorax]|uniref:Myb/SANT-like DNA-binding domain-containing protein n=1 Tax=Lasius platythorax TaxID=488582 RepID=A0AAV2NDF2_9HYME
MQSRITLFAKCSNNQHLLKLQLLDEVTNIEYMIEVEKEDYHRAYKDITFATALLKKAKALSNNNNKHIPHSSTSSMSSITTDNSKSSCSKTNIANEFSDNDSDIDDYNHSETEMQNIESNKEKWTQAATLLLISLYKENSYMLGKVSYKKVWTQICQRMKQEKNYNFTLTQCYNKMDFKKTVPLGRCPIERKSIAERNARNQRDQSQPFRSFRAVSL